MQFRDLGLIHIHRRLVWVPGPRNGAQLISYAPSNGSGAKNKVITSECLSLFLTAMNSSALELLETVCHKGAMVILKPRSTPEGHCETWGYLPQGGRHSYPQIAQCFIFLQWFKRGLGL